MESSEQGVSRVAFVVNEQSPYRIHKLRRFATEIRRVQVRTFLMHTHGTANWTLTPPECIHQLDLSSGASFDRLTGIRARTRQILKGRRLLRELRLFQPTAVVLFGYADFAHLMALWWARRHNVSVLMWGDSNIMNDRAIGVKALVKRLCVSRVVSRCDAILACGQRGVQYFSKYGAQPTSIFNVPNEPDYALIENLDRSAVARIASELGLDPQRRRLVFCGRLIPLKRIDLLIDAFAALADSHPDWDLVLIGTGPLETELKNRVPAHLRQRVLWTGFLEPQERIAAVYCASDVLVLPSNYEAWGLVLNEATCAGLALVCSDVVGAAAELLRDGENGRSFRSGDLGGLIAAIRDVTDEQNLPRYKECSRQVLRAWRAAGDPVRGLERALSRCSEIRNIGSSH